MEGIFLIAAKTWAVKIKTLTCRHYIIRAHHTVNYGITNEITNGTIEQ